MTNDTPEIAALRARFEEWINSEIDKSPIDATIKRAGESCSSHRLYPIHLL